MQHGLFQCNTLTGSRAVPPEALTQATSRSAVTLDLIMFELMFAAVQMKSQNLHANG